MVLYKTSVLMIYFTPEVVALPSWTIEPRFSPCGKQRTQPILGLTPIVSKLPKSLDGEKKVVAPPSKSSFKYTIKVSLDSLSPNALYSY